MKWKSTCHVYGQAPARPPRFSCSCGWWEEPGSEKNAHGGPKNPPLIISSLRCCSDSTAQKKTESHSAKSVGAAYRQLEFFIHGYPPQLQPFEPIHQKGRPKIIPWALPLKAVPHYFGRPNFSNVSNVSPTNATRATTGNKTIEPSTKPNWPSFNFFVRHWKGRRKHVLIFLLKIIFCILMSGLDNLLHAGQCTDEQVHGAFLKNCQQAGPHTKKGFSTSSEERYANLPDLTHEGFLQEH